MPFRRAVFNIRLGRMKSTIDVLVNFATNVLLLPLSIIIGVLIARMVGPEGKGIFTFILLTVSLIVSIGSFGFGAGVNYYVASRQFRTGEVFISILAVSLFFSVVYGGGIILLYHFQMLPSDFQNSLYVFSIVASIFPSYILWFSQRLLVANSKFLTLNGLVLLRQIIPIVFLFSVVVFRLGLRGVLVSVPIYLNFQACVAILIITRLDTVRWQFNLTFIWRGFRYGMKAAVADWLHQANLRFDQLILGSGVGMEALGYYSIAVRLTEMLWYIPNSLGIVLFPKVAQSKDESIAANLTNRLLRLTIACSVVGGLLLAVIAKPLITLLYGSAFAPAGKTINWLLPGTIAYIGVKVLSKYLGGRGHVGKTSIAMVVGSTVSMCSYLILIPKLGLIGAALGSSIGYAASTVSIWYFYRRETGATVLDLLLVRKQDLMFLYGKLAGLVSAAISRIRPPVDNTQSELPDGSSKLK